MSGPPMYLIEEGLSVRELLLRRASSEAVPPLDRSTRPDLGADDGDEKRTGDQAERRTVERHEPKHRTQSRHADGEDLERHADDDDVVEGAVGGGAHRDPP